MGEKPQYYYYQSGVIPYRWREGRLEVLLISSRAQQHWVVPKGIIELGMDAHESAAKEAYEEAGIRGYTTPLSIGKYSYNKWGGICEVQIFPMRVETILEDWPEKKFRRREWLPLEQAAERVQEPTLKALLKEFPQQIAPQPVDTGEKP